MMKLFYFVGRPKTGREDEFFQRLRQSGGSPPNWEVYIHAANDGKALHVIKAESSQEITDVLAYYDDIYEHEDIIEIQKVAP